MSTERITNPLKTRHWLGDMETDYIYTLGVAGERFFKELKKGKLMGAKCPRCELVYLPPRMYCERCFAELKDWVNISKEGFVYTFTKAAIDINGSKLDKPTIYALVRFEGVHGGIIHKLEGTKDPRIGMKVRAILKPPGKRKACINDIECFRPAR